MVLLIDIGNTSVAIYETDIESGSIIRNYRLATNNTEDYRALMFEKKGTANITECVICSVVPTITDKLVAAVKEVYRIESHVLCREDIPMAVLVDEPDKVGMDRLVDAYYAYTNVKLPAVTVDLGTATTFGVITEEGFIGGAISAGMETSLQAIGEKGSQLFTIDLSEPQSVIGRNTAECLNIGAVCGAASMIEGMTKQIEKELGCEVSLVITGGYAGYLGEYVSHPHTIEEKLLVKSMILLSGNRPQC